MFLVVIKVMFAERGLGIDITRLGKLEQPDASVDRHRWYGTWPF